MRLYRIILPVPDIEAAQSFYDALLGLSGERVSPGRRYYDLGGVVLALYDPAADGDPLGEGWRHHENQYVYIAVDDLEAAFARAKKTGAAMLSERIESMPWGERLFYVRDPFGAPVCFVDAATLFTGSGAGARPAQIS
ncbi:VOC family protein [Amphiplicatus metriothermophilus]|nr:VOC family protein [Amphiplicatus metriothermophilus]MBB5519669.1 putative enzyme related to lactoylglutathione lyase [Amphiplicatus metriothermophilus]